MLRLIAELGLPLASIEDEVAERSGYVALYGVVVQVKVEDILQVTANCFSAYEDPARRYSDGILGERCSHGIDVFAIVGVGKLLLQVGILILDNRLSDSTNAPTIIRDAASTIVRTVGIAIIKAMVQNHSPGMYLSATMMLTDTSRPPKQNSASDTSVWKSAIARTDALGNIRVANAVMSPSNYHG